MKRRKLINNYVRVRTFRRWDNYIYGSIPLDERPYFAYRASEFLICLIHFIHASEEDLEVDSHKSKQCGLEVHFALDVHRHVHSNQALVGQQIGTLATKSQGGIDLLEKGKHVHVVDLTTEKKAKNKFLIIIRYSYLYVCNVALPA